MGCLRLFLALVVVGNHTLEVGYLPTITGSLAVKLFFVVSGFYMALILSEKYHRPGMTGLFYSNRALRIFPLLAMTLGFEAVCAAVAIFGFGYSWASWPGLLAQLMDQGQGLSVALLGLAQVSGFGVDAVHLFSFDATGAATLYDGPVHSGSFRGWQALPMSHTWSISCELLFYLTAPWLVRLRTSNLLWIALVAASAEWLLGRLFQAPALASVAGSFWGPLQFHYFISGVVSYRLYKNTNGLPQRLPRLLKVGLISGFVLLLCFYHAFSGISYTGTQASLFIAAILCLPLLFGWTSNTRWDRALGELSYPVYLIHITVIRATHTPFFKDSLPPTFQNSVLHIGLVMALSVGGAWLLVRWIDSRIDAFRQQRLIRANVTGQTA